MFPFFSPVRRKIRALPPSTAILSAIAKNVLHFTSNCVAWTIFLSTKQAGSQSIENLLHEGEAREKHLKHVSGVFIGAVS